MRLIDANPAIARALGEAAKGGAILGEGVEEETTLAWATARLAGGPTYRVIETVPSRILQAGSAVGRPAIVGAVLGVALAALVAVLIARGIARPIVALTNAVRDTQAGRTAQFPNGTNGEIGVLSHALQRFIERERWHSAIIETSNDAIIATRTNGVVTQWNASAARLFGIEGAEAVGRDFQTLLSTENSLEMSKIRREAIENAEEGAWDATIFRGGSELVDLSVTASKVFAEDGTLLGVSLICRDVTDQRQAEEMFRLSVEFSPAGMLLVDRKGTIVLVNGEVERQFGYAKDELVGESINRLVPDEVRPDHPDLMERWYLKPERRRIGGDRDLVGRRKNGSAIDVEVGLTPLPSRSGLIALASVVDITDKKAAARALELRTRELEQSNADLEQFAYVASHDLQEPLRMVASFTQLFADRYQGQIDERADKYIHFIVDGAKRMQQLINDLLVYSRVGSRAQSLVATDLDDIWHRTVQRLGVAIRESGATIEAGPLPFVMADPAQMSRLFQNLLSNALKFRSDAAPVIRLEAVREGDVWHFTLTDNGIGFEVNEAERIFEMFQRLHERGRYDGTGLGLAICKRIVDYHRGRIWADSTPGKGSVFHFTLNSVEAREVAA
nr:PAS domain S-box protein [Acuticoccus kalidii]